MTKVVKCVASSMADFYVKNMIVCRSICEMAFGIMNLLI